MKVTEEMVNKAAITYEEFATSRDFDIGGGVFFTAMRAAIEAVFDKYERKHSRWERFSQPEIKVLAAAVSTLDANGGTTEVIEYAQRLVNETRAVMRNEAIPKANRWDAFSDEELGEINAGVSERADKLALPEETRSRAVEIKHETERELRRRKGGYQGPGVYEFHTTVEYEVLGVIMRGPTVVIMRSSDGGLTSELLAEFNAPVGDKPRYRYLRPLGESS